MRFLFLSVFTITILLQSLQGFFTIVNWKINQDELTAKYCVNKAKPMLNCNGKCYLAKQLKIQEEQDKADFSKESKNQIPKFKKIKEGEVFNDMSQISYALVDFSIIKSKPNSSISSHYNFDEINQCFQPPQFS